MIATPANKFNLNPQTPRESSFKLSGPFKASQLWTQIVEHLKEHVKVKKRRVKLKHYEATFTGSDAVDVVYNLLLNERDTFTSKDISREKATKLCQLMLDNKVFCCAKEKNQSLNTSNSTFEDRESKLYCFMDITDGEEAKENDTEGRNLSTSDLGTSTALHRHPHLVHEIMDITGAWKRHSSPALFGRTTSIKRKLPPKPLFGSAKRLTRASSEPTTPVSGYRSAVTVPPAIEEEIWREVALSQLLTMVEIPILDDILGYEPGKAIHNPGFSNLAFRRFESIQSLISDSMAFNEEDKTDHWLEAAKECLEALPQGHDLLDDSLSEDSIKSRKLRMFQAIADHFRSKSEPLWSNQFLDLHMSLYNLLMQGRQDVAMRSLQLSMLLLPQLVRESLKRILVFMREAASTSAIKLSQAECNRTLIEKTFTHAIIKNKVLTPHQCGQLVMYMMDHADKLDHCPEIVEDIVLDKLEAITKGSPVPNKDLTFCKRISEEEFKKQQLSGTEEALVQLINAIIDDTRISLKEKKQRLKQFQKAHPQLCERYFADML